MGPSLLAIGIAGLGLTALGVSAGWAADRGVAPVPAPASCKATISLPPYDGVVEQNTDPSCLTVLGLGDLYFGGALTGYGFAQTHPLPFLPAPLPADRPGRIDVTNLQAFVQKVDGPFQFFVQAGAYAIPTLGIVNPKAVDQTRLLFGPLPVAFGKIVINDALSIQGGRMPTLIGTEAPFTFQNLNIQRGLLFTQENTINHGVQVNYAEGPWSVSVAATDGFYSGDLTWFTGGLTYKIDDMNAFGINGGLNLGRTAVLRRSLNDQFATPLFQQNSGVVSASFSHTDGPLTLTPYVQFTNVDRDQKIGILTAASTYGAALLASYAFTDRFALAGRVEYEEQTGVRGSGTTSLLYGAGSSATSFTITPTYTQGRFLLRGEYSHVALGGITKDPTLGQPGTGFGRSGNRTTQDRFLVETGVTF